MNNQENTNQSGTAKIPDMKIEVTIGLLESKNNVLALATVRFNDSFAVNGLKVMTGKNGLFVSMPSVKRKDGEYMSIANPLTPEFNEHLQKIIIDKYKAVEKNKEKTSVVGAVKTNAAELKNQPNTSNPTKPKDTAIGE